ncbi:hypothetical protein BDZ97DRAFT_1804452 [Flammula alnicola]|nr:hypothetical protein BDZ97DRAFT_1804452 [Flammula alnicola]
MPASISQNYAASIPVEIWEHCWTYLNTPESTTDLNSLSLTNLLFRDICQPILFHNFYCDPRREVFGLVKGRQAWFDEIARLENRLKWFLANPRFIKFVRVLVFFGVLGPRDPWGDPIYTSLFSTFKSSIGSFINVQEIRLQNIEIDQRILREMAWLPSLRKVGLQNVQALLCHAVFPLVKVEHLMIDTGRSAESQVDEHSYNLFSAERLQRLSINSIQYCAPILSQLSGSHHLVKLAICLTVSTLPVIFSFLEMCPRLEFFKVINNPRHFYPAFPHLPSSAMPLLRSYFGPGTLAAYIAPGRPLSAFTICGEWYNAKNWVTRGIPVMARFLDTSVPVCKLSLPLLPMQADILERIVEDFPQLIHLSLAMKDHPPPAAEDTTNFDEMPPIEVNTDGMPLRPSNSLRGLWDWLCLKKLPLPPKIEMLRLADAYFKQPYGPPFDYSDFYLSHHEQRRALVELSKHYPRLFIVSFGEIDWDRDLSGRWQPDPKYADYLRQKSGSVLLQKNDGKNHQGHKRLMLNANITIGIY